MSAHSKQGSQASGKQQSHLVFNKNDFQCLEKQTVFNGFMRLEKMQLKHRLFEGGWSQLVSRELLLRKDAVAVLLYDPKQDTLVMIEQFRVGAIHDASSPWMLELVAGLLDTDESPEQVAKRECLEEAGCEVISLEPVFEFYLSPGACTEKLYLFAACIDASELGGIHGLASEDENIKVHVLPSEVAFEYLSCGRINNAIALIGLQWLQINRPRLREQIE